MKIKKLNESMLPSQATLDDCLQDYLDNAFGYSGVKGYVDTQYPMHPQEFKAAVCDYLKKHINESLQEAWQIGDQVTIKWNEPNFEPYAYATCEYQGKTKDGKHKFKSTTYGWDFIVDLKNKKIKTPHDKEYDLWDESGWTKNAVNESEPIKEAKSSPLDSYYGKNARLVYRGVDAGIHDTDLPDRLDHTWWSFSLEKAYLYGGGKNVYYSTVKYNPSKWLYVGRCTKNIFKHENGQLTYTKDFINKMHSLGVPEDVIERGIKQLTDASLGYDPQISNFIDTKAFRYWAEKCGYTAITQSERAGESGSNALTISHLSNPHIYSVNPMYNTNYIIKDGKVSRRGLLGLSMNGKFNYKDGDSFNDLESTIQTLSNYGLISKSDADFLDKLEWEPLGNEKPNKDKEIDTPLEKDVLTPTKKDAFKILGKYKDAVIDHFQKAIYCETEDTFNALINELNVDTSNTAKLADDDFVIYLNESKSIKEGYEPFDDFVSKKFPLAYEKLGDASIDEYIDYFYDVLSPDGIQFMCDQECVPIDYFHTAIEDCYDSYMNESKSITEDDEPIKITSNSKMKEIEIEDKSEVGADGHPIAKLSDYSVGKLREDIDTMIYLFPELTDEDLEIAKGYGLKFLGKNHGADGGENNWVLRGAESSLRMFADKYLGYELHPDYLYDEEDFAGEIINESLMGLELDKDDILDWLAEHEQAWADAERHFNGEVVENDADSPLLKLSVKDLIEWIADHKQLYDDFHRFFYEDNLDEEFLNFDFNQNPEDDDDNVDELITAYTEIED